MVLPWYIAVQRRNPTFLNEFFWKHNLERYTTNLYHHHQPFYYYLVVLILGMMPWTALSFRALMTVWRHRLPSGRCGSNRSATWVTFVPATPFRSSWCYGRCFRLFSSPSPIPNFLDTFFLPFRRWQFSRGLSLQDAEDWDLELAVVYARGTHRISNLCADSLPAVHGVPRLIPAKGILAWAIVLGIAAALLVVLITRRFGCGCCDWSR